MVAALPLPPFEQRAIHLRSWSLMKISGDQAQGFLQGQLTCDMTKVTEQKSSLGALCNHQGRVLAVLTLFKYQSAYFCLLPSCIRDEFINHLAKFARFSKVSIEDVTATTFLLGVVGEAQSLRLAHRVSSLPMDPFATVQEGNMIIAALPDASRYVLWAPLEQKIAIENLLSPVVIDESAWKKSAILLGLPTIYAKTMAAVTPHMLNLPQLDAVSLNKGCYVGQEIIARTHYLGKSKRHLRLAKIDGATVNPGDIVSVEGQEVGLVIDAISAADATLFLAVIQDSALDKVIICANKRVELCDRTLL